MVSILTQPPPAPLPGWVACSYRTYNGKRSGPYYVRRWKTGRRVNKQYIKADEVEYYRAACEANRERRREGQYHRRWLTNCAANLSYVEKMCRWEDEDRVRQVDRDYCQRIREEGFDIAGRPPTRRRITFRHVLIAGVRMVVKTVFELDGSTKVFVVPYFSKPFENPLETMKRMFDKWIPQPEIENADGGCTT